MGRPADPRLSTIALLIGFLLLSCDRSALENACQAPSVVDDNQISVQGPPPPPPTQEEASVDAHIQSCSGGRCEIELLEVLFRGTDVPLLEAPKVMTVQTPIDQSYQQSTPPKEFRLILRHRDQWRIDEIRSVDCGESGARDST